MHNVDQLRHRLLPKARCLRYIMIHEIVQTIISVKCRKDRNILRFLIHIRHVERNPPQPAIRLPWVDDVGIGDRAVEIWTLFREQ